MTIEEMEQNVNFEAELSVVGSILIDTQTVAKVSKILSRDDFTNKSCRTLYDAAVAADLQGKSFDPISAIEILKPIRDDAATFVLELVNITPTSANAEEYATIVHNHAGMRCLRAMMETVSDTKKDPRELAEELIGLSHQYLKGEVHSRLKTIATSLVEMYDGKTRNSLRVDSKFYKLDQILKGMGGGNLIVIGARPGVGKSAFAGELALAAAYAGQQTVIYSMEMKADELAERFVSRNGAIPMDKLIDNNLTPEDWKNVGNASSRLSSLPIWISDEPYITPAKIRAEMRAMPDTKMIIIDFLTLMASSKKYANRNLEVGADSRELKMLAMELDIPIIVLAQLNRGVDENERPTLRDLRDSGEIEQNANKVLLLWNIENPEDGSSAKVGVYVAKNRRGRTGTVVFRFDGAFMRFVETSEEWALKVTAYKSKRKMNSEE